MSGISLQEVGGDLVIEVPEEQTLIGRGQFLQVTDKRVSRSHAILDVIERKLFITPNHTNPCFLRVQGSDTSSILPKDVKQVLHPGDSFGLLPDQFYYKVSYPHVNGKDRISENADMKDISEDKQDVKIEDKDAEDLSKKENGANGEKGVDEKWCKATALPKTEITPDDKTQPNNQTVSETKKEVRFKHGNVAQPLDKKRPLPAWMVRIASASPPKAKTPTKKPTSAAVSKRSPGQKLTTSKKYLDDDDDDDDYEDDFEPKKPARGKKWQEDDDDEDFDDNISDDDYVPETTPKKGRGKRKRKYSDSDNDDFSDDDDDDDEDYEISRKKRARTSSKPAKGRGKKGKKKSSSAATPRKTRQRRVKKRHSDDDDDDDSLPRRADYDDDDDDDDDMDTPAKRRPQRAARQKRGSYVDDPMIEEALEDFASEDEGGDVNEDKDSDFEVEGMYESGSDFETKKKNSHKQKILKGKKARPAPRAPAKKGKKKSSRRPSRTNTYSDDDEDVLEDDEPYVPRPSKRRGGGKASQPSDESEDEKKRRPREPCQYGEKCYRKNPVHFRTYCHPGDSSYDEDDDKPAKESVKRDRDSSKTSAEKPSRPQRSTAGTRLVTQGSVVDDDLPDTYDYNDSFIDDGTQPTDDSAEDSDYDAEEDVRGLARDAKKFIKNKKMSKAVN